jgi:hypothetical protein
MPHDKLNALRAELRAMELWDRVRKNGVFEDEIYRTGRRARSMRRSEIMREINALLRFATVKQRDKQDEPRGPASECRNQAPRMESLALILTELLVLLDPRTWMIGK